MSEVVQVVLLCAIDWYTLEKAPVSVGQFVYPSELAENVAAAQAVDMPQYTYEIRCQ